MGELKKAIEARWKGMGMGDWACSYCGEYAPEVLYDECDNEILPDKCLNCGAIMDSTPKERGGEK